MMGSATAVGAGMALMPSSIRHALTIGASVSKGTIHDVEHVVILMQENRSFDHYFGTLRGVRGLQDRFPIPTTAGKPVWHQWNGQREVLPFHLNGKTMNAALVASMPHTLPDAQAAWGQGRISAWPLYKTDVSMGYYTRDELPFQYALADAFTVCDAYHCSLHAATGPNRIVFWTGTNCDPSLRNKGINCDERTSEPLNLRTLVSGHMPAPGYSYNGSAFDWATIPELLEAAGVSWKIYQDPNDNWQGLMHGCLASRTFRDAKSGSPYFEKGMSLLSLESLRQDVLSDRLPAVSWILPPPLKSEHPGAPSSAAQGGNFVEQILAALTANPGVWSRTVFFLTFDENDGFFDHMPPPAVPSLYADGTLAGKMTMDAAGMYFMANRARHLHPQDYDSSDVRPWGMGPRVPMYVISPWSRGGWVNSQVFDHTSVGMFLEKRFGIEIKAISRWHRAVSGDLTSTLDFANPNHAPWPQLPDTSNYMAVEKRARELPAATPPANPEPLWQEPGVRYSRPLPYELQVNATSVSQALNLEFINTGKQGAVFHVYDRLHLDRLPRRYTVEPGQRLEDDAWHPTSADNGRYDVEVHAPNGFFRSFKGSIGQQGVRMALSHDGQAGGIVLELSNADSSESVAEINHRAYRSEARQVRLAPESSTRLQWSLEESVCWYDLAVNAPGIEQRFAGRVETGGPSVSDPAI